MALCTCRCKGVRHKWDQLTGGYRQQEPLGPTLSTQAPTLATQTFARLDSLTCNRLTLFAQT